MTRALDPTDVAARLEQAVPGSVESADATALVLSAETLLASIQHLRDDEDFDLVFLSSLTAVDRETHFEIVYHLLSLDRNEALTCKTLAQDHAAPSVPSLTSLYRGALLQERELFDLMGIRFEGHPNLSRLFLWEGFPGHPLRKDFLGMPGELKTGLPGFPHEPGHNVWPVPGSVPSGSASGFATRGDAASPGEGSSA